MDGGIDDILYISEPQRQPQRRLPLLEWRSVVPELELARQQLQLQLPRRSLFPQLSKFFRLNRKFFFYLADPATEHFPYFVKLL